MVRNGGEPAADRAEAPWRLGELPAASRVVLVACGVAALALRVWMQWGRAFEGDEVGTLHWMRESYGFLLTSFRDPWLTMPLYIAGVKALAGWTGTVPGVLVAPSVLAGTVLVPLAAAVALRLGGPATALATAALVAGNPYLAFYATQLRAYALLVACATAALVAGLDWRARPTWRAGTACAVAGGAAVLLQASGAWLAPGIVVAMILGGRRRATGGACVAGAATLLVPGLVVAAVVAAYYVPLWPELRAVTWTEPPPSSVAPLAGAATLWLGPRWTIWPALALLGVGAWRAIAARRATRALLAGLLVPVALMSAAGLSYYPWTWARVLLGVVPLLCVLIADGAVGAARGRPAVAGALVALVLVAWAPQFAREKREQGERPWRAVAASLQGMLRPGDVVLVIDDGQAFPALALQGVLGEGGAPLGDVAGFLAAGDAAPGRLVVVNPHRRVAPARRAARLGHVDVLVWDGPGRRATVAAMVADLEASLGDAVGAGVAGAWLTVVDARRTLGTGDPDGERTRRLYESRRRVKRWRNTPDSGLRPRADRP